MSKLFTLIVFLCVLGCRAQKQSPHPADPLPGSAASVISQREYVVRQWLTLANQGAGRPEKQNLWVALIRDFAPYQQMISMRVSPGNYTLVTDEYGNQYAQFDFSGQPAGSIRSVEIEYRVIVNELAYDVSICQGALPEEFTQPELHIESRNPQVVALAERLVRGKETVCQQVRAFYDYIGDELVYTFNGKNWGAQATFGKMGADCTEYTSLLVALSRSRGIPARYFEGLVYLEEEAGEGARVEHTWPDVYLPGSGWTALDPTLGRLPAERQTHFAHYTPNHIIVTLGANPSVLRGASYWTHLYWPGDATRIQAMGEWQVELVEPAEH